MIFGSGDKKIGGGVWVGFCRRAMIIVRDGGGDGGGGWRGFLVGLEIIITAGNTETEETTQYYSNQILFDHWPNDTTGSQFWMMVE